MLKKSLTISFQVLFYYFFMFGYDYWKGYGETIIAQYLVASIWLVIWVKQRWPELYWLMISFGDCWNWDSGSFGVIPVSFSSVECSVFEWACTWVLPKFPSAGFCPASSLSLSPYLSPILFFQPQSPLFKLLIPFPVSFPNWFKWFFFILALPQICLASLQVPCPVLNQLVSVSLLYLAPHLIFFFAVVPALKVCLTSLPIIRMVQQRISPKNPCILHSAVCSSLLLFPYLLLTTRQRSLTSTVGFWHLPRILGWNL